MTTFTSPHSLPLYEVGDKIAATGDGLREDLNAISIAANTALSATQWGKGSFPYSDAFAALGDGMWQVASADAVAAIDNLPVGARPGIFESRRVGSTATVQTYREYQSDGRIWEGTAGPAGEVVPWRRTDGVSTATAPTPAGYRTAPIAATTGAGGSTTTGAGFAKYLLTLPPKVGRARVCVRNRNPRFAGADSAAATLGTVSVGKSSGTGSSAQSGVITVATGKSTGTAGYSSAWFDASTLAGGDIIVGLDYTGSGTIQNCIGTAWTGPGTGATGTGATGTKTGAPPFHVWVEVEIPATVPVIAAYGDSLSSGVGATNVLYDSYLNKYCRAMGYAAVHFTHSGDALSADWGPDSAKWRIFGDEFQSADAVLFYMGSNDVFGGATLADMQARFAAALPSVRRMVSPNVYAAEILPRTSATGAAEDVRRSYNTWLKSVSDVRNVFGFRAKVSTDDETLLPAYDSDGIHLNSAGYTELSSAIAGLGWPGEPGGLIPAWKANTAYTAGQRVIAPNGDVVSAKVAFTSGASYSATNWNGSTQDGRIGALEGVAPKTNDGTAYVFSFTDSQDRVALGVKADGSVEIGGKSPATTTIKMTALALTNASGTSQNDTRTDVQARIPVRIGAAATIKAIHFRNYEDRAGQAYAGALSFKGVAWGEAARTSSGQLNGNFTGTQATLAGAFSTPADGAEYKLSGLNIAIEPGKDYLLSYGYTCAAQTNQSGVAGSWTNGISANYAGTTDALTLGKFTPLDVWLEIETAAPIVAWVGDSLSCGVAAEMPGYQSVPMIHARANGYIPLMYTHSGSAMTSWVNAGAVKYTKWVGLAKPDALVFSLSKNDFLTTTDMQVMRDRFAAVYPIMSSYTTTNWFLTTCLPSLDESGAVGTAERAWNEILLNEQLGNAANVFDLRRAITAASGSGLDPAYNSGDGTHLNKRGYAKLAAAIPHNLYTR